MALNCCYFHLTTKPRFDVNQKKCDAWFDVTSVNFNSQKVHEDKIFERQDILQFLSQGYKYYKYVKFPTMI